MQLGALVSGDLENTSLHTHQLSSDAHTPDHAPGQSKITTPKQRDKTQCWRHRNEEKGKRRFNLFYFRKSEISSMFSFVFPPGHVSDRCVLE